MWVIITFYLFRPFTGAYTDKKDPGVYRCVVCKKELFDSKTKFDSRCGWPAFYDVIDQAKVKRIVDTSHGMRRIEVVCAHVSHLHSYIMMVMMILMIVMMMMVMMMMVMMMIVMAILMMMMVMMMIVMAIPMMMMMMMMAWWWWWW